MEQLILIPMEVFLTSPQAEFSGSDAFQFTATAVENSTVSNPATVSITINNVNDSPVVQLTNVPQAWAGIQIY